MKCSVKYGVHRGWGDGPVGRMSLWNRKIKNPDPLSPPKSWVDMAACCLARLAQLAGSKIK